MLTHNAQKFKSFLEEREIRLDFIKENGTIIAEIREQLKSGGRLRMLVVFDEEDSMVSIYGGDFITGISPNKMDYMYEVINELNSKTFFKYVLEDNSIRIHSIALFNDNFSSETVMDMIVGMVGAAEVEYPRLMKIIWS